MPVLPVGTFQSRRYYTACLRLLTYVAPTYMYRYLFYTALSSASVKCCGRSPLHVPASAANNVCEGEATPCSSHKVNGSVGTNSHTPEIRGTYPFRPRSELCCPSPPLLLYLSTKSTPYILTREFMYFYDR